MSLGACWTTVNVREKAIPGKLGDHSGSTGPEVGGQQNKIERQLGITCPEGTAPRSRGYVDVLIELKGAPSCQEHGVGSNWEI